MKTISFRDLGNERSSELFVVALEVFFCNTAPNEPTYGIEGVRVEILSASIAEVEQTNGKALLMFYKEETCDSRVFSSIIFTKEETREPRVMVYS